MSTWLACCVILLMVKDRNSTLHLVLGSEMNALGIWIMLPFSWECALCWCPLSRTKCRSFTHYLNVGTDLHGFHKTFCRQIWWLYKSLWCWNINECANAHQHLVMGNGKSQRLAEKPMHTPNANNMLRNLADQISWLFNPTFCWKVGSKPKKCVHASCMYKRNSHSIFPNDSCAHLIMCSLWKHGPVSLFVEWGVCLNTKRWDFVCLNWQKSCGMLILEVNIHFLRLLLLLVM